jgi:hypothetical protein
MKFQMCPVIVLSLLLCGATVVAQEKKPEKKSPGLPTGANVVIVGDGGQLEYSSKAGRFKINFPGVPRESEGSVETEIGTIVAHMTLLVADLTYSANYSDYPVMLEQPQLVKRFLDSARDEALARVAKEDPHVVSETDVSFDGHPGRLLTVEFKGDAILRYKTVLVGNRSYVLTLGTPKRPSDQNKYEKLAADFFDSFKLIPPLEADLNVTWKEFSSAEGRFKIQFPGTPYQSSMPWDQTLKGQVLHLAAYQSAASYRAMYVDYPEIKKDPLTLKSFLDNMLNRELGVVEKSGTRPKVLSETDITHDGYPGRMLVFEVPNNRVSRSKRIVVNNRVYIVTVTIPKDDSTPAYEQLATKFFDSFQLLAEPEKRP